MEVGRSAYSPLARDHRRGEIMGEVAEHVVNVNERQFAFDGIISEEFEGRPLLGSGLERKDSLRQMVTDEVQHIASETYLITRLSMTLLRYLGIGIQWIFQFMRLCLYALFLMIGFIQVGYYYFFSKSIQRSLEYGVHPRNRFDLYLPTRRDTPRPAVIFITGGAWVIGYKAWGALLARQLVERGIVVACIDYRNFPQGCIKDMVSDVSTGIGHVYQKIVEFGGDPNKIYLIGQSAGAHLGACALLFQAKEESDRAKKQSEEAMENGEAMRSEEAIEELAWKASQLRAYLSLSGGFNLVSLTDHFHKRGLYKSMFSRIMMDSLEEYSPECMVEKPSFEDAVRYLPPILLFHGKADYSIPYEASDDFAVTLKSVGATARTFFYDDKTHTDLILQDPMRGGNYEMLRDILTVIHADDEEATAEDAVAMMRPRMVPECLLQLARWFIRRAPGIISRI